MADRSILQLAISCLILAAKASELEDNIPYFETIIEFVKSNVILQQYQDSNFSQDEHIAIEKELLEKMEWNALQVTHFDFLEHY